MFFGSLQAPFLQITLVIGQMLGISVMPAITNSVLF